MINKLTFKNEDGTTRVLETEKFGKITPSLFAQIKKANLDAGKGELISVEDVTPKIVKKKSNLCPKCGTYCYGDCQAH